MYDVSENTAPASIVKLLSRISFFILTIHSPQPLSIFIQKNRLDDKRNAFLTCWGQNLEQDTSNC